MVDLIFSSQSPLTNVHEDAKEIIIFPALIVTIQCFNAIVAHSLCRNFGRHRHFTFIRSLFKFWNNNKNDNNEQTVCPLLVSAYSRISQQEIVVGLMLVPEVLQLKDSSAPNCCSCWWSCVINVSLGLLFPPPAMPRFIFPKLYAAWVSRELK